MQAWLEEIRNLYGSYPEWLVTTCLVIVGLGLAWVLWKLVRIGMVILVTVLLVGIAGFVGYLLLGQQ